MITQKQLHERAKLIFKLRSEKKTLREIGKEMTLSGETIRLTVRKLSEKKQLEFARFGNMRRKPIPKPDRECKKCKALFSPKRSNSFYCSQDCMRFMLTKKYKFSPMALPQGLRSGWLWKNDEVFKTVQRKRMHSLWERNKQNPKWLKRYHERQRLLAKRSQEKRKYGKAITPLTPLKPLK